MPNLSPRSTLGRAPLSADSPERRQQKRMLLAVLLLLVAVGVLLFKDRYSLRSDEQTHSAGISAQRTAVSEPGRPAAQAEPENLRSAPHDDTPSGSGQAPAFSDIAKAPVSKPLPQHRPAVRRDQGIRHASNLQGSSNELPAASPGIVATRTVLPPLRIEVVAGDRPSPVQPGNPSLKVDMLPGTPARPTNEPPSSVSDATDALPLTNASDRVQLSADTTQVLTHKVRPEYPLLARQMKVQGSVVLDAMIGKDGGIQDLEVVQGPTILAEAAREAVRQWRFKPYLQDGQPVETQAHITVNFMISTN